MKGDLRINQLGHLLESNLVHVGMGKSSIPNLSFSSIHHHDDVEKERVTYRDTLELNSIISAQPPQPGFHVDSSFSPLLSPSPSGPGGPCSISSSIHLLMIAFVAFDRQSLSFAFPNHILLLCEGMMLVILEYPFLVR
jgi:hypothetical protein